MIRHFIIVLLVFLSGSGFGQKQSIKAIPDTNMIFIGEQIKLAVSIAGEKGAHVVLPTFLDTLVDKVEIVDQTKWDTIHTKTLSTYSKTLFLTSFDSGLYIVPPIITQLNNDSIGSTPFLISVFTIPIDSTNAITDIKALEQDPLTFDDYYDAYGNYLWLGIALVIILFIVYRLFKNRKPAPVVYEKPKEIIPPHIIALEKLTKLREEKLWQNNRVKQYHVQLSEIVREYIELRFGIMALEQTTDEIMRGLRLTELTDVQKQELRKLFMLTDLVKFAKERPIANENEEIMQIAFNFVESTKSATPSVSPNNSEV